MNFFYHHHPTSNGTELIIAFRPRLFSCISECNFSPASPVRYLRPHLIQTQMTVFRRPPSDIRAHRIFWAVGAGWQFGSKSLLELSSIRRRRGRGYRLPPHCRAGMYILGEGEQALSSKSRPPARRSRFMRVYHRIFKSKSADINDAHHSSISAHSALPIYLPCLPEPIQTLHYHIEGLPGIFRREYP